MNLDLKAAVYASAYMSIWRSVKRGTWCVIRDHCSCDVRNYVWDALSAADISDTVVKISEHIKEYDT